MYAFGYHRVTSVPEAVQTLGDAEDGLFLAGGQTLLPTLKQRLAQPGALVDLKGIGELDFIREDGDALVVGALTRHADVAASDVVKARIPALAALAGGIGDPMVRNRGTLGGSIANADPAADYPAALVGLGAVVTTDRRDITAEDFFVDLFTTALEPGEIVLSVRFPKPAKAAYQKMPNPASGYATVGVFVARDGAGVRVAVTGAGPKVFRVAAMEQALNASFTPEAAKGVAVDPDPLNDDLHASRAYRASLIPVLAARAVAACG